MKYFLTLVLSRVSSDLFHCFPPGQRQHCERGGRRKGHQAGEPVRRCNQELMERSGHPGELRSEEGIPAIRLHEVVSKLEN